MLRHPIFSAYGFALVTLASWAGYQGWTWSSADEVRGIPRSVRDNPGIYRSIYTNYSRYSGGK